MTASVIIDDPDLGSGNEPQSFEEFLDIRFTGYGPHGTRLTFLKERYRDRNALNRLGGVWILWGLHNNIRTS